MTTVPILLYHSVDPVRPGPYARWVVTPQQLGEHLDGLAADGWTPIDLPLLLRARSGSAALPRHPYLVTVDDGLADFTAHALPVLRARDVPSVLLVTTRWIGRTARWLAPLGQGRRPMLSQDQLVRVAAAGDVHLGAHGHSHAMLDLLPPRARRTELDASRTILTELVGPMTVMAYPHGYGHRAVRRDVRAAGFTTAFGVHDRLCRPQDDELSLSRLVVDGDETAEGLLQRLHSATRAVGGGGRVRAHARAHVLVPGWRAARRLTVGPAQRRLAGAA